MPRIYCPLTLVENSTIELPDRAVKHIQVLRLQPGQELMVFNGFGGEFSARIEDMGRHSVRINVQTRFDIERENAQSVHLIVGMPANDRMDWLVEKATELGVQRITPLMTQRSVLRLQGDRAFKKTQHWQLIAIGACEQCGRNRVPLIDEPVSLPQLLKNMTSGPLRYVLSTQIQDQFERKDLQHAMTREHTLDQTIQVLSGPEGGLEPKEEDELIKNGFSPWSLGSRVLRAETASLYALMSLTKPA